MSLNEKVNVIRKYHSITDQDERKLYEMSSKEIMTIIANKNKILKQHALMQKTIRAAQKTLKADSDNRTVETKTLLLEEVMLEWYHRMMRRPGITYKITYCNFLKQFNIAKNSINVASLTMPEIWYQNLRKSFEKGLKCTKKKVLPLKISDILKYVLEKAAITLEEAESAYGMNVNGVKSLPNDTPTETLSSEKQIVLSSSSCVDGTQYAKEVMEASSTSAESNIEINSIKCGSSEQADIDTHKPETFEHESKSEAASNEGALKHLKPLKDYLILQKNVAALELLAQMEILIKQPKSL